MSDPPAEAPPPSSGPPTPPRPRPPTPQRSQPPPATRTPPPPGPFGSLRVAVFGAGGRMGSAVCRAVSADRGLRLVGAVDPGHAGRDVRSVTGAGVDDLQVVGDPEPLRPLRVEVAVDFTHIEAARANLQWCGDHGVHAVVGTTGFEEADYERLRQSFSRSNCFIVPNFAVGAVLMMRFAQLAAPWFETAEIVELHHDNKLDAPSGTAVLTAERMAAASSEWGADPTRQERLKGARGAMGPAGIRIHSVRLRGLVAHQEVVLGTTGQSLSIRHDSYDRESFMPGVLLAVKSVAGLSGVTVGLDALLDV